MGAPNENRGVLFEGERIGPVEFLKRTDQIRSVMDPPIKTRYLGRTYVLLDDEISKEDFNLIRQWFDAVQDLNPRYLEKEDFVLARKIYETLSMRTPESIINRCQ